MFKNYSSFFWEEIMLIGNKCEEFGLLLKVILIVFVLLFLFIIMVILWDEFMIGKVMVIFCGGGLGELVM